MPQIKPYTEDDLSTWQRLLAAYLLEYNPQSNPESYWDKNFFSACHQGIHTGTHRIWLVRNNIDILGFSLAYVERPWQHPSTLIGKIEEFYIVPKQRRQGIGRVLAQHTIDDLRVAGATKITAALLQTNIRAFLFWQNVGFTTESYTLSL